jgi:sensor histidine kinase YesM
VSEPETRLNRLTVVELPRETAESGPADGMLESRPSDDDRRSTRIAIALIAAFWSLQWLYFTIDDFTRAPRFEGWPQVAARAIVSFFGALISFGILKNLQRCIGMSFVKRTLLALALAYGGAAIHSLINWTVFLLIIGPYQGMDPWETLFGGGFPLLVYLFSWVYLAITVLLLSLTYGEELVRRERRIAQLTVEADRARLSALRYQLSPHFLFNSLNSAASLVSGKRNADAELMLENLADFLRATLKLSSETEISLKDELALQALYLGVEQVRFPSRLGVAVEVPNELVDVLVPTLITQPLIENSIKHSVAQSTDPVHLRIAAREADGKLEIRISDDGGNAVEGAPGGAGVGLKNVARRLELHFGADARFEAGAAKSGGFEAVMTMPIRRSR